MKVTQELVAENLLWGLWRSITEDYKTQYFDCVKICDDNRNHVELAASADIVDLDAYGLVMKNLRDILTTSSKTQLIFFTESNPFCKFMSKVVDELIKLDITAFWIEKSNQSNVFYGYVYRKI